MTLRVFVDPRRLIREFQAFGSGGFPMTFFEQMPIVVAALQYSLLYMLCGGGVVGAVGVFAVAKMLGK